MKKTLKEQMMKVYESNDKIKKVLDEKSFSTFIEAFDGEFKKVIKRRVTEEKKQLSEEFNKYNKSMQLTYEKNLAKAIDCIIEDLVKITSKNTIKNYVGMVDKYFTETINTNIKQVRNVVQKEAKKQMEKRADKMGQLVKQNKYGFVIEQLQSVMKSLALVEDVNLVKGLKTMATKYNKLVKVNKEQKRKTAKVEMTKLFNEAFGSYSAMQKNNIRNMLKVKKFKSLSEFKKELQIIKTGLNEGIYNVNKNKSKFKRNINERKNKKSNGLNETFINNINDDYYTNDPEVKKYFDEYYKQLKK